MTALLRRSPAARAMCTEYFGRNVVRGGKRVHVDNRCDSCPLRAPCLTCGGAPARTMEELNESIATFNGAAAAILGEATP